MLTPFQISDRVNEIRRRRNALYPHDELGRARIAREIIVLYKDVLREIAKGSLDARSLALAAMKVED